MTAWILSSSILILILVGLRALLKGKIAPGLQYALWLLVLVRLLVPGSLTASRMSVANLLPQEQAAVSEPVQERGYEPIQTETPVTVTPEPSVHVVPDAVPTVSESKAAPLDWSRLLTGIWLAGMLLAALALLSSNLCFYLRLCRSRKKLEPDLPLPVYQAEGLPSPCLFGLLRPAVYVPAAYAEERQVMAHILAHEWSHYKQGDHFWSLLRGAALCIHWFNPLVWLAAVLSKQDAELACDAAAIRRLGEEQRIPYGRTLLKLVTGKPRPADLLTCATTMTSGKRSLKQRIAYIAKKPKMLAVTAVLVVLAAAVAVGCTFTGAETLEAGSETLPGIENPEKSLAWTYISEQITALEDSGYTVLDAEDLPAAWMEALGSAPGIQYDSARSSELRADLSTSAQLAALQEIFSAYTWTPYVGPSTANQSDLQMRCASADGTQTLLFQEYQGQVRVYATLNGETSVYDGSGSGPITTALLDLCNEVLLEAQGDMLTIALNFPTEKWGDPDHLGYLTDLDTEAGRVTFDEVYWVDAPDMDSGFHLDPGPEGQTLPLAEQCEYWILYRHSFPCLRVSAEGMRKRLSEGGLFRLYLQDGQVIAICQRYIP